MKKKYLRFANSIIHLQEIEINEAVIVQVNNIIVKVYSIDKHFDIRMNQDCYIIIIAVAIKD